jgi:hypothetical protein
MTTRIKTQADATTGLKWFGRHSRPYICRRCA